MDQALKELVDQLDLELLEVNLFRGRSRDTGTGRVFGGQVIGQALVAAERTVDGRSPHSLHAYFLLPGDVSAPIVYQVDRIRDGRSFSARRVQAIQHGRPILSMIASFQVQEPGLEHSAPMPPVPPPEELAASGQLRAFEAIELRRVEPPGPPAAGGREAQQALWFRVSDRVGDDPQLHRCLLAYASDLALSGTALRAHGRTWRDPRMTVASIDHALWFHRAARVDDWLLYAMESPSAQGARGLSLGQIYDRGGRLVASVAQEAVMREAASPAAR